MVKKKDDWEYVESKSGSSRQTKSQKKFQRDIEDEGGSYVVKRQNAYDDLFQDFDF